MERAWQPAARRALDAGQPHTAVDAYLGEAALLQNDTDDARQWLAPGQFDPASAQRGFHALGRLELGAGHFAAAAKAFDEALRAGKPDARLWVDIGRLRYQAGEQHLRPDGRQPSSAAAAGSSSRSMSVATSHDSTSS